MRWFKRILLALAILLTLGIVLSATGIYLYRHPPAWYAPKSMSDEQRLANARSAEDKMVRTYNWASQQSKATAPVQVGATTVTFSADEINAFFEKWEVLGDPRWQRFVADPMVVIQENRLVLAGLFRPMNTIVSLHFEPGLDEKGQLHLGLKKILGGRLPLPTSFFLRERSLVTNGVGPELARWKREARLDGRGTANDAMIAAAMTELFLTVFEDRAAEPVVFLPVNEGRAMPAKLVNLQIRDASVTLTVQPMNLAERKKYLTKVKSGGM